MEAEYKSVDDWLGEQSVDIKTAHERLKWSIIYLSDAWVEIFNHYQLKLFKKRSQAVSRIVAVIPFLVILGLAIACTG